ncbi:MAG: WhiB family transcriptional regulator [Microthrixaceae bacterium]|nr:WhiB family transcriptional regulator [Microthrixaceae bacterium]HPB45000.1 WhiB family transcriptional regulator [Microthrixaceae bacterium]
MYGTDYSDTSWMSQGNCSHRDPAMFFPSDGVGVEIARKACQGCPVIAECLEYAISERIDHGVWGGCSERERRRIIRARAQAAKAQPVTIG